MLAPTRWWAAVVLAAVVLLAAPNTAGRGGALGQACVEGTFRFICGNNDYVGLPSASTSGLCCTACTAIASVTCW